MTVITKENGKRELPFDEPRLRKFATEITTFYPHLNTEYYMDKTFRNITSKEKVKADNITNSLVFNALEQIGVDEGQHPDWTYVAALVYLKKLYKEAAKNRGYDASEKYGDLYVLLKQLTTLGIYDVRLLQKYSKEEIKQLEKEIDPTKDHLFTYIGLHTLRERYLATNHTKETFELPQERWMIIAMYLMINEPKHKRLELVKESYWALSNLYMTVASPTMKAAGLSYGQLSSCFIDYIDDSLRGIYDSNTDVALLSKDGGGIGVYAGAVRALGSDIKGFKGVSSGVVPWIKQLNNTAVSVDQLGSRNGSIAVYLDVWHKDIRPFLDLRLNNGDERKRARDIFTGVCLPDLFMEAVEKRNDWYLFDPHEVETVMGFRLEEYFDEQRGNGSFREKYYECVNHPSLTKEVVPAIDIMKRIMKSELETGTPYHFYRDEANRMNPNKKYREDGSAMTTIYCSNLCTEIYQNQSPTVVIETITKDGEIIVRKKAGDFVVCNLSSINLGNAVARLERDGKEHVLKRLIPIQVRMLDNVIDLNEDRIEVKQAVLTNQKYRAIGLGTFGLHHTLALKKIKWESDRAVEYNDTLYEEVAYLTIKASMELAKEKGAYPEFEGSEWQSGEYFVRRGYGGEKRWDELAEDVAKYGVRNGWMMAVAPNGQTSIVGGSSASIDPIFKRQYAEEKKDYKIPVTAPDLSAHTFWFYRNAYELDQHWSIKQNAARQRHVDQGISFNLYVNKGIKASELLNLHLAAWKSGMKSTYYTRSTSSDIKDCEACHS